MPITWPLSAPTVAAPGVIDAGSDLAPDSPIDVGVPFFHPQADFLTLAGRFLPDWYVSPLQANGTGYELLQSYAKMFEKVSLAVGQFQVAATMLFSSGGQNALASVQFFRTSLASGAFTLKAGSIVSASMSNRQYQTTVDIPFGLTDYFKTTLVQSLGQDSDYNVRGPVITADGTLLNGEIDTVVIPVMQPAYAEPAIAVRQVADAYGGTAPVIDQLGSDRGIARAAGETDPSYKKRARQLPDTVSPAAIRRHLDAVFYGAGLQYDLFETWQNSYQACWDAPVGGGSNPVMGTLVNSAWDDPRTDRFIPRWMGEGDHRGAYVLVVPNFPTLQDRGVAWDDPIVTPTLARATPSWDSPVPDTAVELSGVWDGVDAFGQSSRATFLTSVWNLFHAIKGGGVNVMFVPAETSEVLPLAPYP